MKILWAYRNALTPLGGMLCLLSLGFISGYLNPSLHLASWGFGNFFIVGCALFCVALLAYILAMKSPAVIWQIYTPRAPPGKSPAGAIMGVCLTCCIWGASTGFFAEIVAHLTAHGPAHLSGKIAGFGNEKSCTRRAHIVTDHGNIEACVFGHVNGFHVSTPMPDDLTPGENVVLVGRENRTTFVLDQIQHAAHATPSANAIASADMVYLSQTENEPLVDQAFPVLKEAYQHIGISVAGKKAPGERSLAMVNSGEFFGDVVHIEGLEKYYVNMVRVPVPLIHFDAIAFTAGRNIVVSGWPSMASYEVCIRRGIKAIELATAEMKNVHLVNSYEQVFAMLKVGRCDVGVLPRNAWLDAQRLNVTGLRSLEPPLQTWPLYHYVHRSHADVIPALTQALRKMQKDGTLKRQEEEFWNHVEEVRHARTN